MVFCIYCGVEIDERNSYRGRNACKSCVREKNRDRYNQKKEYILNQKKEYYSNNKEEINKKNRDRYDKKKEQYRKTIYKRRDFLRETDGMFRLKESISKRIREILLEKKDGVPTLNIVGYTKEELRTHIEKQFDENMSWDNYGSYWHLEHIIPKSLYDFSSNVEIKKAWSLRNLRPLEASENLSKGSYLDKSLVEEYNIFDLLPNGVELWLQLE